MRKREEALAFRRKRSVLLWFSTSTQIAGFAFDNCLMNAAGVACMTKKLAEVKDTATRPL